MNIYFKLKVDHGVYKKGEVFDCFGGMVHGICDNKEGTIRFNNRDKFKMVKNQKPTK